MKNAFVNVDGVLTGLGYADSNNGDRLVEVPEDAVMEPGQWRLVDGRWELTHPDLSEEERRIAAVKLLASTA
ncbi:hypothetical protein ABL849_17260 [Variovorax sp. 375MFSha3.1]|uniref:hypothetical protein n=1 Tax=Variovorax sp. 375MFSha3.1 TaxID=3158364 RepID=UPI003AACA539